MQRRDAWSAWVATRAALALLLALAGCGEGADRTRGETAEPAHRRADPTLLSDGGRRVAPAPALDATPPEAAAGARSEFTAVPEPAGEAPLAERGGDLADFAGVDLAADAAGAGGGLSANVYSRLVGSATVRFWLTGAARTGRSVHEYSFGVSVQNRGTGVLEGAVIVTSARAASRIVDPCAAFGVTPPGLTRAADHGFVVAQDRSVAFDPAALVFQLATTADPALCSDPGRVTMRRLNRFEYDNTVRDLLGTTQRPGASFPTDDSDHGFDTVGDALSFSPLLLEKAERAADALLTEALRVYPATPEQRRFEAELGDGECGNGSSGHWNLYSECSVLLTVPIDYPGTYELRVRAYEDHAGGDYARLQVSANGVALGAPLVIRAASRTTAEVYTLSARFEEGTTGVELEFVNDYYVPDPRADRNVHIDWLEVVGPLDAPPPAPQMAALRALCDPQQIGPAACHRQRIAAFARLAWRRPLSTDEIAALAALADAELRAGGTFDDGLGVALRAVLTSPFFLFKVERGPHPLSAERTRLSDHELATRLAYLLWASTPDEALLALADQGGLQNDTALAQQVNRMVHDPRFAGFGEGFAGQWLGLRALEDVNPDPALFPTWDQTLRDSLHSETLLFFLSIAQSPRSFLDLLDAEYSFLNDASARHYGVPRPGSASPVHVVLPANGQRGGILSHGSLLAVNAQMSRTSPVKRGKWILDQLLCVDIPPPPPGVEGLLDMPGTPITGTLRERLAQHRARPECAACHDYLDPLGLGLENYDAVGAWRTRDNGIAIDASGRMPDGRSFDGPEELTAMLKADPATARCIVERVFVYGLGRGVESTDAAELDRITALWGYFDHRFEALISLIAQSEPFRSRRGEHAGGTP